MKWTTAGGSVTVWHANALAALQKMPENSVDAIVTDPPYGLGFMGKAWDDLPPGEEWAKLCLRVLKPGGHLLAFGGTRTWHRLAVAVEDAGFEMRDSVAWLYGSGFPKSLDVSKAIDKAAGVERQVTSSRMGDVGIQGGNFANATKWGVIEQHDMPATPDAEQWQGWGTALKPAFEPIVVARKPLDQRTVAANVLTHGTGALNIDGCRIEGAFVSGWSKSGSKASENGRWPANVILDESQAQVLDQQSGKVGAAAPVRGTEASEAVTATGITNQRARVAGVFHSDSGGASRFFYVAKAGKKERPNVDGIAHPTVKPLALMRWLVRLVTPPGGTVLDPFGGSGTTAEAAILEGFGIVLIEREVDYLPLIEVRVRRALAERAETLTTLT